MANPIAIFDKVEVSHPTSLDYKIPAGNHYAVRVTNDSDKTILCAGTPLYPQGEFVDEKPVTILLDAFTFATCNIGYDIPLVIPSTVADLAKIYISIYYFKGIVE